MTRTSSRWAPSEATVYDLASTRSSTPIAADAPSVLGLQAYRAATAAAVRDARTYSSVAPPRQDPPHPWFQPRAATAVYSNGRSRVRRLRYELIRSLGGRGGGGRPSIAARRGLDQARRIQRIASATRPSAATLAAQMATNQARRVQVEDLAAVPISGSRPLCRPCRGTPSTSTPCTTGSAESAPRHRPAGTRGWHPVQRPPRSSPRLARGMGRN